MGVPASSRAGDVASRSGRMSAGEVKADVGDRCAGDRRVGWRGGFVALISRPGAGVDVPDSDIDSETWRRVDAEVVSVL